MGVLHLAEMHALHHRGRLQQVGPVLGEDPAPARLAHPVPGPADALQPGGHRSRRGHLHDQVHRAHVDAQLERGGGHQPPQLAPLELVLDQETPLPGDRPMVGLDQLDSVGRPRADLLIAQRNRRWRLEQGLN